MPTGNGSTDGQLHDLYTQSQAARERSQALVGQLGATQRKIRENWQLIQASWGRSEHIRALSLAAQADPDYRRYSVHARLRARLASLPVIEQAKGIIMATCGWPEDKAFDALRRASQRENVKVRDIAARIVAGKGVPGAGLAPAMNGRLTGPRDTGGNATRAEPARERRGGEYDHARQADTS